MELVYLRKDKADMNFLVITVVYGILFFCYQVHKYMGGLLMSEGGEEYLWIVNSYCGKPRKCPLFH